MDYETPELVSTLYDAVGRTASRLRANYRHAGSGSIAQEYFSMPLVKPMSGSQDIDRLGPRDLGDAGYRSDGEEDMARRTIRVDVDAFHALM